MSEWEFKFKYNHQIQKAFSLQKLRTQTSYKSVIILVFVIFLSLVDEP